MAIAQQNIVDVLRPIVGEARVTVHQGQLSIQVEKSEVLDALRELRDHSLTSFEQLIDVTVVDWANTRTPRFEVVYFLYSIRHNDRLRIKVGVAADDLHVPTVTGLWDSANWYERESYDMYGVIFDGHPDLRRFYMPEDYVDPLSGEALYPLRKDYPLMGVPGAAPIPDFPERERWKREKEDYLNQYPSNPLDTSYTLNS